MKEKANYKRISTIWFHLYKVYSGVKFVETDPKKIWSSNIFGKSLHELVNEGLHNKLYRMPDEAQMKLQETLQRIINEGGAGLICIIL